jgi:hypothetical protein
MEYLERKTAACNYFTCRCYRMEGFIVPIKRQALAKDEFLIG